MHQLQQSWVRSQHPSAQWNLRGGRLSSAEYSTKKIKIPKKIFLKKVLTAQSTKVSIVAFEVGNWFEGSSTEADHTVACRHHPLNRGWYCDKT
jgi:hypothetical protein